MDNIINKIFPPKCIFCSSIGSLICENCLSDCDLIKYQRCILCGKESTDGYTHPHCLRSKDNLPIQIISTYEYSGKVRECIRKSKYYSRQFMVLKILAREALEISYELLKDLKDFICVPIPISINRYKTRGFNQTLVIASIVGRTLKMNVKEYILKRIKDTKAQHSINKEERVKNVAGSFQTKKEYVLGKKILLIDDISTTGSTFIEASRTLYNVGAKEVRCFSLSKKI